MAILEGGQILAKALKCENVEYLFTLCGGTIESIYEGCLDEDIKIVDVRVDQSATMMADGARTLSSTSKPALFARPPPMLRLLHSSNARTRH